MDPVLDVILQYGVIGIVIGWFMWRDVTVMREFKGALEDFSQTMARLDYALVKNCEEDDKNQH